MFMSACFNAKIKYFTICQLYNKIQFFTIILLFIYKLARTATLIKGSKNINKMKKLIQLIKAINQMEILWLNDQLTSLSKSKKLKK
jgi:hypothetical protein